MHQSISHVGIGDRSHEIDDAFMCREEDTDWENYYGGCGISNSSIALCLCLCLYRHCLILHFACVCLSVCLSLSLFLCVSSSLGRIRRLVARALDVRHAPQLLFKPSWASGGDSAAAMSDAFRRIEEELQNDADESGDDSDTESSQRERRSDGDDAV